MSESKRQRNERQRRRDEDFRTWLSTAAGRRVYVRLLEQSGLYSSSYAESPTATAYNEGRRSVAIALMLEGQRVTPELHVKAMMEQAEAFGLDAAAARKEAIEKAPEEALDSAE